MISRHWKGIVRRGCAGAYIRHLEWLLAAYRTIRRLVGAFGPAPSGSAPV
jgi:hypothetical protein